MGRGRRDPSRALRGEVRRTLIYTEGKDKKKPTCFEGMGQKDPDLHCGEGSEGPSFTLRGEVKETLAYTEGKGQKEPHLH